jgi:hypothetical protein
MGAVFEVTTIFTLRSLRVQYGVSPLVSPADHSDTHKSTFRIHRARSKDRFQTMCR